MGVETQMLMMLFEEFQVFGTPFNIFELGFFKFYSLVISGLKLFSRFPQLDQSGLYKQKGGKSKMRKGTVT
jgi:hypothetical protein